MNVLVTGAGLIGAHTARRAADAGDKTVLFELRAARRPVRARRSIQAYQEPSWGYRPQFPLKRLCGIISTSCGANREVDSSVGQPKSHQIVKRRQAVFPGNFLSLGIGSTMIGYRNFVEAALFFGKLDGDLGLKTEAFGLELYVL